MRSAVAVVSGSTSLRGADISEISSDFVFSLLLIFCEKSILVSYSVVLCRIELNLPKSWVLSELVIAILIEWVLLIMSNECVGMSNCVLRGIVACGSEETIL